MLLFHAQNVGVTLVVPAMHVVDDSGTLPAAIMEFCV